jgi:putative GTP pyrophosphokinase
MATESEPDDVWNAKSGPLLVFGPSMEGLLRILVNQAGITPHSIGHRVKDRESVERKIAKRARADYTLDSLTDVLGLRVITYFDQEVDRVAEVIEREFLVDRQNSVDKRAALDPDRFGYLSLHYVVQLDPKRAGLPEYREFEGVRFEIQVRSILQHAWAEIEHDLGYKSKNAIPDPVKRRFSRLAGLLELADMEFTAIRADLVSYEEQVSVAVRDNRLEASIDRESMAAFINESPRLRELEEGLVEALHGRRLVFRDRRPPTSRARAEALRALGVNDLRQLDSLLEEHGDVVARFARNRIARPDRTTDVPDKFGAGFLLLYLQLFLALEGPEVNEDVVTRAGFVDAEVRDGLVAALNAAKAELRG